MFIISVITYIKLQLQREENHDVSTGFSSAKPARLPLPIALSSISHLSRGLNLYNGVGSILGSDGMKGEGRTQ